MIVLAALTALALSAPADTSQPFGGKLPYPPPKLAQPTEKTKCDLGTVLAVEAASHLMRGTTPAGIVTYKLGPDVQVFGKDGKPAGGVAALAAGQKYRAYYVIDDGARIVEIDLE